MIYPFFFQLKAERLFVTFIALKRAFFLLIMQTGDASPTCME